MQGKKIIMLELEDNKHVIEELSKKIEIIGDSL